MSSVDLYSYVITYLLCGAPFALLIAFLFRKN